VAAASFAAAGVLQFAALSYSVALRRAVEGAGSVFIEKAVGVPIRVAMSQYIMTVFLAISCAAFAILMIRAGDSKVARSNGLGAGFLAAIGLFVGMLTGQPLDPISGFLAGLSIVFALLGAWIVGKLPRTKVFQPLRLSTLQVTTSAVFAGLTAALTSFIAVPSPTGGYTGIGDTMIFVAALLFGPRVGGLSGAIGAVAADLYTGYDRWFISIPAHGLEGIIAGFARGRRVTVQVALLVIGGFVMASSYFYLNVFIRGLPVAVISYVRDLFGQAGISLILSLIVARSVQRIMPGLFPKLTSKKTTVNR
jgi:uncharacterized membrane protein